MVMRSFVHMLITAALIMYAPAGWSQPQQTQLPTQYQAAFEAAYEKYPTVPRGLLEAVAFTNTRFTHLNPGNYQPSCIGIPAMYTIMGLTMDGKGYFKNNLKTISKLSGIAVNEMLASPEKSILAYAAAYSALATKEKLVNRPLADQLVIVDALSELPDKKITDRYALDVNRYAILTFLKEPIYQTTYRFRPPAIDLIAVFGENNYRILSSKSLKITEEGVFGPAGMQYDYNGSKPGFGVSHSNKTQSVDYPPAITDMTTCNYSSRSGASIEYVTIHTVQGTYAGCISWFKNCAANVSAHYVMRAVDGQVTQMVLESNKAWHVGNWNPQAIGIEHEGWIDNPAWYTKALYASSAALCQDICASGYGINPLNCYDGPAHTGLHTLSNCYKIKGHQHFSMNTHVDPGPYWDWKYFYSLINPSLPVTNLTAATGTFVDDGGAGNYALNTRTRWLLAPTGATTLTLTFSSFNVENNYDYLTIYDGENAQAPLIGRYTGTTLPGVAGVVTGTSGKLYIEWYSDCGTTAPGWNATWNSSTVPNCGEPTGLAAVTPNHFTANLNWNVVPGATGYEVRIRRNYDGAVYENFSTATNALTVTGLAGNAVFQWQVRAVCAGPTYSGWIGNQFTTPAPAATTTTTLCTGRFRDSGGLEGDYINNEDYTITIAPPGATAVTMVFSNFNTYNSSDNLKIYNGTSIAAPLIGTYSGTGNPGTVVASSGAMTLRFVSSSSSVAAGWNATWSCTSGGPPPPDATAPTTAINPLNPWYKTNFNVNFVDQDNTGGSGVDQMFYCVQDYNGTEWRSNPTQGFYYDDFNNNTLHTDFTAVAGMGTWSETGSVLKQTDESIANTNIYFPVSQTAGNTYVYSWRARVTGTGSNRRHGIHFFCSNGSQTQRGDSYLAFFRLDNNQAEIYKAVGNVIGSPVVNVALPGVYSAGTWYDYKVLFNQSTGKIELYRNDILVCSWTDPSPHTSGNHVSLRAGNALVDFDDFKVYRHRNTSQVTVTVGAGQQARYESPNAGTAAVRIATIINDSSDNWSNEATATTKIDFTPPTTTLTMPGPWYTADFVQNFTDTDPASGVDNRFYLVEDFNGTEWRANGATGFFSDNFDGSIHSDWTIGSGNWAITSGNLLQSNESISNTNLYAAVNQPNSGSYLYHWKARIGGTGTNRRAGLHIFASSGSAVNRGDSYLIWFRVDDAKMEIYRIDDNALYIVKTTNITVPVNTWNDYKVIFTPGTGVLEVYRDDILIDTYTDPVPFTAGSFISLRSGNATYETEFLRVYRSRPGATANVTVGSATKNVRFQSPNPTTNAVQIRSIVQDGVDFFSTVALAAGKVDWTAPPAPATVNDGTAADIATTTSTTTLSANWTSVTDPHSGIAQYEYAIGTTPCGTNIVGWTNNGLSTSVTRTSLSLTVGMTYYFTIRVKNGAGLYSVVACSDGQTVTNGLPVNYRMEPAFNNTTVVITCATSTNPHKLYDSGGPGGATSTYYANNEDVTRTFCAPPGQRLRIKFLKSVPFSAPNRQLGLRALATGNDYLFLYNGSSTGAPMIGAYTGNTLSYPQPGTITSNGQCITLRFKSNADGQQGEGFTANVYCVPAPTTMPTTYVSGPTIFRDMGGKTAAPGDYFANEHWIRTYCPDAASAAAGLGLWIEFLDSLYLEENEDYLTIYNGDSPNSPIISTFTGRGATGSNVLNTIKSTETNPTGCLTFEFYSNESVELGGWNASLYPGAKRKPNGADTCANATPINSYGTYAGMNINATGDPGGEDPSVDINGCVGGPITRIENSLWYTFTTTPNISGGSFQLSISNVGSQNFNVNDNGVQLSLYQTTGCLSGPAWDAVKVFCQDEITALTPPIELAPLLQPNTQYYLMIDGFADQHANFDLNISGNNVVFPVTRLSLSGSRNGKFADLNWIADCSPGTRGFYIERAIRGQEFKEVGYIAGPGAACVRSYHYQDTLPSVEVAWRYRIRKVDYDNGTQYSNLIELTPEGSGLTAKVYPNPFTQSLQVSVTGLTNENSYFELFDVTGRSVLQQLLPAGTAETVINTENLPSGIYTWRISSDKTAIGKGKVIKN